MRDKSSRKSLQRDRCGGRDHSTVIHAIRKIATLSKEDQKIASDLAELRIRLSTPDDDDTSLTATPLETMSKEIHAA